MYLLIYIMMGWWLENVGVMMTCHEDCGVQRSLAPTYFVIVILYNEHSY